MILNFLNKIIIQLLIIRLDKNGEVNTFKMNISTFLKFGTISNI